LLEGLSLRPEGTTVDCDTMLNPVLKFTSPDPSRTIVVGASHHASLADVGSPRTGIVNETMGADYDDRFPLFRLKNDIPASLCAGKPVDDVFIQYGAVSNYSFYRYEPTLRLVDNTLDSPASVPASSGLSCPAATRNRWNAAKCVRQTSCSPPVYNSKMIALDETSLKKFYSLSGLYVYYITGIPITGSQAYSEHQISPCTSGHTSRWIIHTGACDTETTLSDAATKSTILSALQASTDANPYVRDVDVVGHAGGTTCDASDAAAIGMKINVGSNCYENTHVNNYDVFDASPWLSYHPGGWRRIAKPAQEGSARFMFPASHSGWRWFEHYENKKDFGVKLGRFGDTVDFKHLPTSTKTEAMAAYFNAVAVPPTSAIDICGSEGEVANDPSLGHRYEFYAGSDDSAFDYRSYRGLVSGYNRWNGISMVLINLALKAQDQLRQRVSWALAQIWVIGTSGSTFVQYNEPWHAFHDILVRNAFGDYRNIISEVSYSRMMADYLTYHDNRAKLLSSDSYPDENYAREIMQLFTIGLWKLNMDGSRVKVSLTGHYVLVYLYCVLYHWTELPTDSLIHSVSLSLFLDYKYQTFYIHELSVFCRMPMETMYRRTTRTTSSDSPVFGQASMAVD